MQRLIVVSVLLFGLGATSVEAQPILWGETLWDIRSYRETSERKINIYGKVGIPESKFGIFALALIESEKTKVMFGSTFSPVETFELSGGLSKTQNGDWGVNVGIYANKKPGWTFAKFEVSEREGFWYRIETNQLIQAGGKFGLGLYAEKGFGIGPRTEIDFTPVKFWMVFVAWDSESKKFLGTAIFSIRITL